MGCIQPYSFSICLPLGGTSGHPFWERKREDTDPLLSLCLEIHAPKKTPFLCPKIFSLLPENEPDFTQKEGTLSAKKGPNST